jgi:hypothetical protein
MPITISGSTGIAGVDGSASIPAIQGSDTDSGVYFSGSTVGFSSNGSGTTMTVGSGGNVTFPASVVMSSPYGIRNRLINGAIAVDQRNSGASQTITAGAALAYTVDRWYAYCTGANVTGQRVANAVANTFSYRFTGAASVTAIGFGQRIEAINSADLAGTTAVLSVELANSLLTTVTWTAFYANTTDTFGTLASPTVTQIATGTFTVNSTLTRYSTSISIPSAATTGLQIVFTVGAQTSGTWTIDNVQLEPGNIATPFQWRPIGMEVGLCYRYYRRYLNNGTTYTSLGSGLTQGPSNISRWGFQLDTPMRATPTLSIVNAVGWNGPIGGAVAVGSNLCSTNVIDSDLTTSGLTNTVGLIAKILMLSNGYVEVSIEL